MLLGDLPLSVFVQTQFLLGNVGGLMYFPLESQYRRANCNTIRRVFLDVRKTTANHLLNITFGKPVIS